MTKINTPVRMTTIPHYSTRLFKIYRDEDMFRTEQMFNTPVSMTTNPHY